MPNSTDQRPQGGIPDGLLVGLLAFLLGLAVLTWTSTGLAALFAKGAWPDKVTFTRTPTAVRSLIAQPQNIPAAWPDTPPEALSNWGLFWGLFISQLLILLVLAIFTLGIVARTKARRTTAPHPPGRPKPNPAPPAFEERGPGGWPPATAPHPTTGPQPIPAPPAIEARGPGGWPPATAPHPATVPIPTKPHPIPAPSAQAQASQPIPAPPAFEARGPGARAPGTSAAPSPTDEAYRYGFGYAPTPAPPATPPQSHRMTYAPPEVRTTAAEAAIAAAQGAILVITSSPTLWSDTKDARSKLGPVLLYDPSHLCDTPARIHWNPTEGCADRDTAAARAIALLAPVRPQARMDSALADTAETLLRSWLQAAALDNRPFKQLHRWAQGTNAQEPVRILRTHPQAATAAPGAAGELESALTAHPDRREQAQHLTARALTALSSIHIRESCTPNRSDSLALASFVSEGGTLYVVGEPLEDPRAHPGAMPLLTALASSVVEHGRRMAARSSDGRLDPPLTLVFEDVAAVAPIPQLPQLLQDTTLPLLALCRSREQARSRWPEADLPVAAR
ncbi:type VI secretion protein [Streptomyces sp. NBC_00335]|uniref:type VI secretion protein n=1 Tax=unclassified Streptomyces TaxID=2593676 RepID=UPI002251E547|nr:MULTISPECIES: type VI secretion protein [unclassified Streptomyces]MCX5406211.1 type VI secretion protein [Streptomyces sp. NBC_00086]